MKSKKTPSESIENNQPSAATEEPSLFMEERKAEILTLLAIHHKVTVPELSKRFAVSTATIRTYLRDLESAGQLVRTHGGAIEKQRSGFEPMTRDKESQHAELKQAVAAKALALVEEGDVILIDTGTTGHAFTRRVATLGLGLTVVTNDILIASELESAENIQIFVLGGLLRHGLHCTVGIQGQLLAEGIVVDKAFMGTNAFSVERGATTPDINQAASKQQMVSMAHKVYLLCDHTKIGRASFARFATVDNIDVLVCDDQIAPSDRKQFESAGIEVL